MNAIKTQFRGSGRFLQHYRDTACWRWTKTESDDNDNDNDKISMALRKAEKAYCKVQEIERDKKNKKES